MIKMIKQTKNDIVNQINLIQILKNDFDISAEVEVKNYGSYTSIGVKIQLPQSSLSSNEICKAIAKVFNIEFFTEVEIRTICVFSDDIRFNLQINNEVKQ